MNPHARPVEFPRKDDGLGFAWSWEGQRFTPAYEARAQHLFEAISLFPDWTPAIEFEGSEDGEVIVAYYKDTDHWRYLFPIEDPSEQEWVDELIAADQAEGVACETPNTENTVFVAGLACAPNGLMAYLRDYFAEATPVAEAEMRQREAALKPGPVNGLKDMPGALGNKKPGNKKPGNKETGEKEPGKTHEKPTKNPQND